jgi:hypothetical protein
MRRSFSGGIEEEIARTSDRLLRLGQDISRYIRGHPGAPNGNTNALKHGRDTAQAIASRREVAALVRAMRSLARATSEAS